MKKDQGILENIAVIDMTEGVAGPYAAMALADMGANVVKVERPEGDWSRPANHCLVDGQENGQFISLNRNKRNIGLDASTPEGKEVLSRMLSRADVLISNYRPGVMAKLGFDYSNCQLINPNLIYCIISGFGQEGPYAQNPASDTIIQAMSGLMSLVGDPDGPPTRVGFPLVDMAAGNAAIQGILLALYGRLLGKGGANIEISLMAAALGMMTAGYTRFLASGIPPKRQGNANMNLAPAGAYKAGDGRYISIAILRDSHWAKFCAVMGLEDLINDPRYRTNADRVANRKEIDRIIEPMLASCGAKDWIERLQAADILAGPINDFGDVASDTSLTNWLPIVETMAPNAPWAMGTPIRLNGAFAKTRYPAPAKGENTIEIMTEFGFSADEIAKSLESGTVFKL
jgi:crotonobetainyl-CoA:carnitine CoA-transferase CaiB-like acyl-CoA transferase